MYTSFTYFTHIMYTSAIHTFGLNLDLGPEMPKIEFQNVSLTPSIFIPSNSKYSYILGHIHASTAHIHLLTFPKEYTLKVVSKLIERITSLVCRYTPLHIRLISCPSWPFQMVPITFTYRGMSMIFKVEHN